MRRCLAVLDHAFDLLPSLVLLSLFIAGPGLFVVTFPYGNG